VTLKVSRMHPKDATTTASQDFAVDEVKKER
jgi:hypothetical protein